MMERVAGIEPASQAWKASALPLRKTEKPLIFQDFILAKETKPREMRLALPQLLPQTLHLSPYKVDASTEIDTNSKLAIRIRLPTASILTTSPLSGTLRR
jgi:uncharacterized Rmd1/YagE family protein